jgi:hypothetical protein
MSTLSPTPNTPNIIGQAVLSYTGVKSATPDIVLIKEDATPIETIVDLVFENIGGQELINISRNDTVSGQQIYYNPIKNLSIINQQYNPKNIIALQQTSDKYFQNFAIKVDNNLPLQSFGPNNLNVYLEPSTGDIVVDVINLEPDERVEIQVAVGGTIYEAEL